MVVHDIIRYYQLCIPIKLSFRDVSLFFVRKF